jgi:hypothetical protein
MERKLVALALIAAGVWVQWGPGFALVVAGALFGASGIDLVPVTARARQVGAWTRQVGAAMPRRTVAVALIVIAAVMLPWGALLAVGAWGAALALGGMTLALGAVLGWE